MPPLAASCGGVFQDQETDPQSSSFEERVARFAQVEVRPQQQAFRDAVFRACGGRCVVSGCEVPEALEAAHIFGRDWRKGENSAEDGILLRRDLHALYDRGLLTIQESGAVELDPKVRPHYKVFDGVFINSQALA
ncbi:HNH endonuclease [Hydrogenophaga pseudoflava]|uniref:HNH endonuclease n=1 Tax=Hydrogenophaga pseudoflava TaxID=47421 RepID=UPI0020D2735D|nr:HNH endonuclease [Hydrogenophaga pseudoflava]